MADDKKTPDFPQKVPGADEKEIVPATVFVKGGHRTHPLFGKAQSRKSRRTLPRGMAEVIVDDFGNVIDSYGFNTVINSKNTVISRIIIDPNLERDTSPPVDMPQGDETPLLSKENIQSLFSAAVDAKAIGLMLAGARTSLGMTKVAVAAAMEKSEKSVRAFENGEYNPTLPKIQEYAEILGYDVEIRLIPNGKNSSDSPVEP